jgi:hypothetical protein
VRPSAVVSSCWRRFMRVVYQVTASAIALPALS